MDDDEWGFDDRKPGLASEAKAGMAIIVLLVCTFAFMVYRKFDQHEQLAALGGDDLGVLGDAGEVDGGLDISPGESGKDVFGEDGSVTADAPRQQLEPKVVDEELFFGDQGKPQPESTSVATMADTKKREIFDDSSFKDDEFDFGSEPPTTTANSAMAGQFDDSSDGFGFDDKSSQTVAKTTVDSASPDEDLFFSDDPMGRSDSATTVTAAGEPEFDEPAFNEPEFDEPVVANSRVNEPTFDEPAFNESQFNESQFDEPIRGGQPDFEDEAFGASSVATVQAKPISDDFEFGRETNPTSAEPPARTMGSIGALGGTSDNDAGFFDEPDGGMLFDDRSNDRTPVEVPVAKEQPPSRDEIIAADRNSAIDDNWGQQPRRSSQSNVTAQPVDEFDDSLFGDKSVVSAEPEFEVVRDPVREPVREPLNPRSNRFELDDADDNLLFDDPVASQPPGRINTQPVRETDRDQFEDSRPVEPQPRRNRFTDERVAAAKSKFSDPIQGDVLFDDPSTPPQEFRSRVDQGSPVADGTLFDDRDRRVRAEPAVMRRDDLIDEYVVRRGDNYWRISKNKYGTERFYQALARLNLQRVPDPKRLRPGMKLHTPSPESLIRRFPELFPNGIQSVSQTRSSGPSGFFLDRDGRALYRTRSQDTLSSIAQNHLGRASRWKQIYQLNRSTLKNPNVLKDGLVLVLPDDASQVRVVR